MPTKALIAYASWYGTTAEIAKSLAAAVAENGGEAAIARARDVKSVAEYDAVIVGSAVRVGKPHKDAIAFLKKYGPALVSKKTAVFVSCMTRSQDTDAARATSQTYVDMLTSAAPGIMPLSTAAFGGTFDKEKASLLVRAMFWMMKVKPGDYRDWDAIRAWAADTAKALVVA
jgi:menaquinone-dependent protoporphyrinogen oxidase